MVDFDCLCVALVDFGCFSLIRLISMPEVSENGSNVPEGRSYPWASYGRNRCFHIFHEFIHMTGGEPLPPKGQSRDFSIRLIYCFDKVF